MPSQAYTNTAMNPDYFSAPCGSVLIPTPLRLYAESTQPQQSACSPPEPLPSPGRLLLLLLPSRRCSARIIDRGRSFHTVHIRESIDTLCRPLPEIMRPFSAAFGIEKSSSSRCTSAARQASRWSSHPALLQRSIGGCTRLAGLILRLHEEPDDVRR